MAPSDGAERKEDEGEEEEEEAGGKRRSRLKAKNAHKQRHMTSGSVCSNELSWVLAERCLRAFIISYDSVGMRRRQGERKKKKKKKRKRKH